jgi:hypothetical protein
MRMRDQKHWKKCAKNACMNNFVKSTVHGWAEISTVELPYKVARSISNFFNCRLKQDRVACHVLKKADRLYTDFLFIYFILRSFASVGK